MQMRALLSGGVCSSAGSAMPRMVMDSLLGECPVVPLVHCRESSGFTLLRNLLIYKDAMRLQTGVFFVLFCLYLGVRAS